MAISYNVSPMDLWSSGMITRLHRVEGGSIPPRSIGLDQIFNQSQSVEGLYWFNLCISYESGAIGSKEQSERSITDSAADRVPYSDDQACER